MEYMPAKWIPSSDGDTSSVDDSGIEERGRSSIVKNMAQKFESLISEQVRGSSWLTKTTDPVTFFDPPDRISSNDVCNNHLDQSNQSSMNDKSASTKKREFCAISNNSDLAISVRDPNECSANSNGTVNRPLSSISDTSNSSMASISSSLKCDGSSYASMSSSSPTSQITSPVEELLLNEETYIRNLTNGINGCMNNFERKSMPDSLRGQKFRIFGNIHRIKDFHENKFLPALKECDMDVIKICKTFQHFIELYRKDTFTSTYSMV